MRLHQRIRWGLLQDRKFYGMWKVFPVDKPNAMREFFFFEKSDADAFITLLDKSVHEEGK